VLALRNRRELAELKTQLLQPGSSKYHKRLLDLLRREPPITAGNNGGTGVGDCIGFLEGAGVLPAEIDTFDAQFNLPPANLTEVLANSSLPIPLDPVHHEAQMDVEWAHTVASNTPMTLYIANDPTWRQGQFDALNLAVSQNACGVITSSVHDAGNGCADIAQIGPIPQLNPKQ